MSSIVINYRYQSIAIGDWYRVYRLISDIDFYRSTTPVSLVTSCNNSSRRQITPCVQVGRLVAATRWETRRSDKSLRVYWRIFVKICLHNRILPLQQVAKNQIRLNLCDLLRRQILLQRQRFSQKFSTQNARSQNDIVSIPPFYCVYSCLNRK